jgi:hypothetical protein
VVLVKLLEFLMSIIKSRHTIILWDGAWKPE